MSKEANLINAKNNYKGVSLIFIKVSIIIFIVYFALSAILYYLAGESFHYRASRGNIELPMAIGATIEITEDTKVEETFISQVQILESFSIRMGTYARQNTGNFLVELYDMTANKKLYSEVVDISTLSDTMPIVFTLDTPYENVASHTYLVGIYGIDGEIGNAITPLLAAIEENLYNRQLYYNGQPIEGNMSLSVQGKDFVWTGSVYWQLVLAGSAIIVAILIIVFFKIKMGKKNILLDIIFACQKYFFLMQQLVARDFKTKYKRSVLGVLWSFLNPLMIMLVQYFVFSNLFKSGIENYHIYLLIGIIMFSFFNEACGMTLMSIVGNASLITKVYMPKYIYPISRIISSAVNLLISLIPLFIIIFATGIDFSKSFFLVIYPLACLIIFSLGVGMVLSSSMVFFKDTQFLWGIFSMLWMYATPIFYPISILPEKFQNILKLNPLYNYITFVRTSIMDGVSPEPRIYVQCMVFALISLVIGFFVFKKTQDKFIFYI